jgi:hypothetical protein
LKLKVSSNVALESCIVDKATAKVDCHHVLFCASMCDITRLEHALRNTPEIFLFNTVSGKEIHHEIFIMNKKPDYVTKSVRKQC